MFSPTNLPARAFYVTSGLNVRECTIEGKHAWRDYFETSSGYKADHELFADRLGAISEAGRRLHAMQQKHKRSGELLRQKEARVAALQKDGAA